MTGIIHLRNSVNDLVGTTLHASEYFLSGLLNLFKDLKATSLLKCLAIP